MRNEIRSPPQTRQCYNTANAKQRGTRPSMTIKTAYNSHKKCFLISRWNNYLQEKRYLRLRIICFEKTNAKCNINKTLDLCSTFVNPEARNILWHRSLCFRFINLSVQQKQQKWCVNNHMWCNSTPNQSELISKVIWGTVSVHYTNIYLFVYYPEGGNCSRP